MSRIFIAVALAVLLVFAGGLQAAPEAMVGKPAPAFTAVDQEGRNHSLESLDGKVVVLEWTNPECPFVQRHYREGTFKELSARYGSEGVVWFAVNSTNSNKAENSAEWMKKNSIAYPTLIDSKGELGRLFGAKSTPHVFVIDREGKLVYHGAVDDDPNGQKQPAQRQQYLENAIKAALKGQAPERSETRSYGCSVKYSE